MDSLPRDIILYVGKMLDINSLCNFRSTAQRYNSHLRGERFWLYYSNLGQPWILVKIKRWWLERLPILLKAQENSGNLTLYFTNDTHIEIKRSLAPVTFVEDSQLDIVTYRQADNDIELITRIHRKPRNYLEEFLIAVLRDMYWQNQSYTVPNCISYSQHSKTNFLWYSTA